MKIFHKTEKETTILTLFLPGEGGISPLIVCHVTPPGRNRVKGNFDIFLNTEAGIQKLEFTLNLSTFRQQICLLLYTIK